MRWLLLPLLASCGGGPWYVDNRFTETEEVELEAAAELWRERGASIDFVYGTKATGFSSDRREIVLIGERAMASLDESLGRSESAASAQVRPLFPSKIFVVREAMHSSEHLRFTFAHELGHALGLRHVADDSALMHHEWTDGLTRMCVTESDAAEYCRATGCVGYTKGCDR